MAVVVFYDVNDTNPPFTLRATHLKIKTEKNPQIRY